MKGFPYIPIMGSFCENKNEAMEFAKMYAGLPHRVSEIEKKRNAKVR